MFERKVAVLPRGMPNCLKKRRLLNDKTLDPQLCREYGEKFLALGFWEDALEFFQRAGYQEGLEKLRTLALENGDAYLLSRLGAQPPEIWQQAADQALRLGKFHFARRALEQAGDRDKAEELNRRLQGGGF
ncbi:MAG: hypothetical protein ACUVXF_03825 [Desulfobaccales bacterium]